MVTALPAPRLCSRTSDPGPLRRRSSAGAEARSRALARRLRQIRAFQRYSRLYRVPLLPEVVERLATRYARKHPGEEGCLDPHDWRGGAARRPQE